MNFPGTPAITELFGTFLVTIVPAPIITLFPISISGNITEPAPFGKSQHCFYVRRDLYQNSPYYEKKRFIRIKRSFP